jgi:outer membrane lipoprotein-sorting protein
MITGGTTSRAALALAASLALLGGPTVGNADAGAGAAPRPAPASDAPPATLLSGAAARGAATDPVLALLAVERMSCTFREEKRVALLARPLTSSGTIHFERSRGIARSTKAPKVEHVVLTRTSLRIRTASKSEEIPLDKSKDLRAFALIFPTLLRGDRAELERSFELGLHGSTRDWWALTFTPKAASLKKLVKQVVVFGRKAEVVSLRVTEASGDTTVTQLTDIRKNADVTETEIATAFGAR